MELESFPACEFDALPCGHWFSLRAWRASLEAALGDPLAAQTARCLAAPACHELVRPRLLQAVLSPESLERWREYGVRRFARDTRCIVWCPGAGCPFAVVHREGGARSAEQVQCSSGHAFCFGCGSAAHSPATCEDAAAWARRDTEDGANALYLQQNTKACPNPKCRQSIERTSGCNKVTCSLCGGHMCWACGLEYYKEAGHSYPQEVSKGERERRGEGELLLVL